MTSDSVFFEFVDCERLLLEEGSFKNSRGPISARIERINQVVIPRATFTWLSDLFVSRVEKLRLHDEAFLLNNSLDKQGISTPYTEVIYLFLQNIPMNLLTVNALTVISL